ncbi:MAG: hypothetical protein QW416_00650 [Candidatus Nitrosocaldaceae archaeon]
MEKIFEFKTFNDAIDYVNEISAIIKNRKVYPLITIDSNKVIIGKCEVLDEIYIEKIEKIYEFYKDSYIDETELDMLKMEEEKEKAKHRSRGPYRKSSSAGLF